MNRRQRRAAEKKLGVVREGLNTPLVPQSPLVKSAPFAPKNTMRQIINQELERAMDAARATTSNDTMNLVSSAFSIVLKEFYEFADESLKDVLAKVFEQLELCGAELVSIDEMMDLCRSYGIETFIDEKDLNKLGEKIFNKQKVFDLLDQGMTEIEDLHMATGVCSKDVSAFRWEYNMKKYGGFEMSKMSEVIKMLDAGVTDLKGIAKETGLKESSVRKYMTTWRQDKQKDDIDALADAIFGSESVDFDVEKVESDTDLSMPPKTIDNDVEENKTLPKECENPNADRDKMVSEEKPKMVLNIPTKKRGPKITRKVEVEGEFGTYIIENRVANCRIGCVDMGLEKQQLLEFIEELQVVVGEMQ